ncbi:MAG: transglutaminase domain-containing protein [Clostridium sp.]|uniref:transglutaminase domain-containing protein n=1 Tax=Clostridium sp. TaxID=1506 RepID=UPI003D6CA59D
MRKNNMFYRVLIFAIITAAIFIWNYKVSDKDIGLSVTKWKNFYSGDNIHFYYLDPKNENLSKLKTKYKLDKIVDNKVDQLANSLKIMNFINEKVKAGSTSMTSDKTALQIMDEAFNGGKISDNDYTTIYEECLASVGISVRRGVLRSTDSKVKGKSYFNVCEIWSDKYQNWIMIDGVNGCYMSQKGIPLGATQIIDKEVGKVEITGIKDTSKYIKNMGDYYQSYSISIDNNKYGELKSNSKITYLKDKQLPNIETKEGFIQPTIFVNDLKVFSESPTVKYVDSGDDKVPTLIFAKRDLKNDTKDVQNFTIGAFMNSYMVEDYFISVNGSDYIKVDTYYDLKIIKAVTSIKLSQDGKTLEREVIIEK